MKGVNLNEDETKPLSRFRQYFFGLFWTVSSCTINFNLHESGTLILCMILKFIEIISRGNHFTAQSASYTSASADPTNIKYIWKKLINNLNTFTKVTVPRQERVLCVWKRPLLKQPKPYGKLWVTRTAVHLKPSFPKYFFSIMVISRNIKKCLSWLFLNEFPRYVIML